MHTQARALQGEREPERLLLSLQNTAASLDISVAKIYAEIRAGELETTRIGDRQLTTREQREAYIARKQKAAEQRRSPRRHLKVRGAR